MTQPKAEKVRCAKTIMTYEMNWPWSKQCSRMASIGKFCKIHDPDTIAAKEKAADEKYEAQKKENHEKYHLQSAVKDMQEALESALKVAEFEKHPFRSWHDKARAALSKSRADVVKSEIKTTAKPLDK